jgi:Glycogen recognition site of AMP-activated protein kinase
MIDDRDELMERVARSLRPLPPGDPRAAARILAAVRDRRAPAPRRWMLVLEWMSQPAISVASAGLLAAAALAIGFVTRGALSGLDGASAPQGLPVVSVPLVAAANEPRAVRPVPVPITFDAASAMSVSIVGDFNDWDSTASPLARFGSKGPWTVTVNIAPGRHLYAFMVDGKLVVDPRAPRVRDLDYGGDASVLMVNTP